MSDPQEAAFAACQRTNNVADTRAKRRPRRCLLPHLIACRAHVSIRDITVPLVLRTKDRVHHRQGVLIIRRTLHSRLRFDLPIRVRDALSLLLGDATLHLAGHAGPIRPCGSCTLCNLLLRCPSRRCLLVSRQRSQLCDQLRVERRWILRVLHRKLLPRHEQRIRQHLLLARC